MSWWPRVFSSPVFARSLHEAQTKIQQWIRGGIWCGQKPHKVFPGQVMWPVDSLNWGSGNFVWGFHHFWASVKAKPWIKPWQLPTLSSSFLQASGLVSYELWKWNTTVT
jgi:hypothetical protein